MTETRNESSIQLLMMVWSATCTVFDMQIGIHFFEMKEPINQ
jgi:hypothetical protein